MLRKIWIGISNKHSEIYKYFLILSSIVVIVLAMPRQVQFNYIYKKGKPWKYDNLMAPFDFAILKSEDELNREKSDILATQKPFYKKVESVKPGQLIEFAAQLTFVFENKEPEGKWNTTKQGRFIYNSLEKQQEIKSIGEKILADIYDKGIIQINHEIQSSDGLINLLDKNVAEEKNLVDFYTIKAASELIEKELKNLDTYVAEILQPVLENCLAHNILYDDHATRLWSKQALEKLSATRGMVQAGEVIVLQGQVIDEIVFQKLESLKTETRKKDDSSGPGWLLLLGHFILVSLALSMLFLFLYLFRKEYFVDNARILLLLLLILMVTLVFLWVRKIDIVDIYIVPLCILPIIVRTFFDSRTALFTHVITLMIISFEAPSGFEFMFVQTIAGMVATFSITDMHKRSQFFITSLLIFAAYAVSFIGVGFIHEANLKSIDWTNFKWVAGNTIITLFAFPLIYVFERTFGFVSDVTLMEICDSNSPLLRELAFKAPGTFQHSMQVANLTEAAIYKIGGNPLLARAGAMYHDIGKIDMPGYFIENLNSGANPHDNLSFEDSARIIRSHVIRGIEKGKKNHLPETIIDFIRTHHGTSFLQYFYHSFLKNFPEKVPDEEQFRYPGPLPFSKETAALMMADSVEAASRSLVQPDEKSIRNLVESIINNQVKEKQFENSPLTLKDISDVKRIFIKMLVSIYHVRIEYPH